MCVEIAAISQLKKSLPFGLSPLVKKFAHIPYHDRLPIIQTFLVVKACILMYLNKYLVKLHPSLSDEIHGHQVKFPDCIIYYISGNFA